MGVVGNVALALGMAAFTGLLAQLRVSLPFTPEPTTGEVFAALLAGALLGRWYGGLSQVIYGAMGGAGVIWFAGWSGGPEVLGGVSGGYVLGFVVAAFGIGWLTERYVRARSFLPLLGLMWVGVGIIYFFVAVWLATVPGAGGVETLSVDVFPFIPAHLITAVVVAAIASVLLPKTAFGGKVEPAAVARRRVFSLPFLRRGSKRLTRVGRPVKEVRGEARPAAEAESSPEAASAVEAAAEEPEAEAPLEASPVAEAAAEEPEAEAPLEARAAAEGEDIGREPTEEERNAIYSGEVHLSLVPPLNAAAMSRLHSLLLSNPELKILRTVGSWQRGTTITVFLDRPLPLVGVMAEIPELRLSSRLKPGGRGVAFGSRITIIIKGGQADNQAAAGGE